MSKACKVALGALIICVCAGSIANAAEIDIVVNAALEVSIHDALAQYRADLQACGYTVTTTLWPTGSAQDLRQHLQSMYARPQGLDGTVFIGALPTADFHKVTYDGSYTETWPTDLYYMDLNGTWTDTDADGYYDSHTGNVTPEIWFGRISADTLGNEATKVTNYLSRAHDYKSGTLSFPEQAVMWVDDDWSGYWGGVWANEMRNAYPSTTTTLYDDVSVTSATHWTNTITSGAYEFWHQCIHSNPSGLSIENPDSSNTWINSTSIPGLNPEIGFYNFFDCSFARYTNTNYGAGEFVFATDYGLAGVGSTKTGGMLNLASFYNSLGAGDTMGEALFNWLTAIGSGGYSDTEIDWFYGMTLLGDPTIGPHTTFNLSSDPVPLPSSLALMSVGAGIGALLAARRRRPL